MRWHASLLEAACHPPSSQRSEPKADLAGGDGSAFGRCDPARPEWQYEPKWDGFRCLLSRQGGKVDLRSKSGEDLTRYFPELVEAALKLKATEFVLDGEIVVPHGKTFSFDELLQRIHPAASRIRKLSEETPALFLAFDLLANCEG